MTTMGSVSNLGRLPLAPAPLGVLSIHLDGMACRVGCEFCYLGARTGSEGPARIDVELLEEVLTRLDYAEVAVAVSEPAADARRALAAIVRVAASRGRPVAVTTTAAVLAAERGLVGDVQRVNLSVDPRKGPVAARAVDAVARSVRAPGREMVLLVTLVNERFAEALLDGMLAQLVELSHVDKVALQGLKPPPSWCDRAFWLRACTRIAPLLEKHLDRRLFLDCTVAARILRLGDCPARPDISPGNQFRSCVYQPAPDFTFASSDELASRLSGFVAPATCPFPLL